MGEDEYERVKSESAVAEMLAIPVVLLVVAVVVILLTVAL